MNDSEAEDSNRRWNDEMENLLEKTDLSKNETPLMIWDLQRMRVLTGEKDLLEVLTGDEGGSGDGDLGMREESIAARIEGLMIEGDINNDSDGTQTGFSGATLELGGDSDKLDHVARSTRASRKLIKGFH
ncbi:hypothetical protein IGI04_033528 [Brassica rapa subsp. trilocularis]|nr:hypothetical protein IGI04_033528 [Brassica rapa subsp. trilocularis]